MFAECVIDCQSSQLWLGVAIGFIVGLLLWALVAFLTRSKSTSKLIVVSDSDRGDFAITPSALSQFVNRILQDYPEMDLGDMKLVETHDGLVMNITVKVAQETDLLNKRKELRDRIYAEMDAKLGIAEQISAVNIEAVEFVNGPASSK